MRLITSVLVTFLASSAVNAATYTYNISWVGANGYSLAGSFSFDSSTLDYCSSSRCDIEQYHLTDLSLAGYQNSTLLGTYSGLLNPYPEESQFNFDYLTESLQLGFAYGSGPYPARVPSQMWNIYGAEANTIGFGSGTATQSLYFNGHIADSTILTENSTLTATLASVPIPAAAWLFGSALAGLGWMRRRQTV